jgi:[protein-PII] uridylyltransferase
VTTDPWQSLRLAAVAAEHDVPIAQGSLHRLAEGAPAPSGHWPDEGRRTLVRVLAAGKPAIDALEALDHHGLLVRVLPEWQAVRNRPQRNAYHRYTVDRHLLEAATNAAALVDRVERPDLLLVGTLLHDIGKGFPGDHTDVGMTVVREIAERMGFDAADVDTIVHMVQYHLLLPDVATRRDLADPATIDTVARAAGDVSTLRLLWALTEADSLATGPSAWGNWKAGLVATLVERTALRLEGQEAGQAEPLTAAQRALLDEARSAGALIVQVDPPQVAVAGPDRRGLLASAAGTLALHGLDVRSADVVGEGGMALELFTVEATRGRWPAGDALRRDLEAVLSGQLRLAERLAAKAVEYAGSRRPATAHPIVPEVSVDNEASASSTVIELRTTDEVGLLHRVTQALFDSGLDVVTARVATSGTAVVDAFYVRRPALEGDGPSAPSDAGTKVTDTAALAAVERALLDALG